MDPDRENSLCRSEVLLSLDLTCLQTLASLAFCVLEGTKRHPLRCGAERILFFLEFGLFCSSELVFPALC